MADFSLKPIIMFFVVVVIGVVFVGEIADNQIENTELSSLTNESLTLASTFETHTTESITITSRVGTINVSPINSITFFGNASENTEVGHGLGLAVNYSDKTVITNYSNGVYNITYTVIKTTTGTVANGDVTAISFLGNTTHDTNEAGINIGAQVNISDKALGTIDIDPHNFTPGVVNISYEYEGALYVIDKKSHPLLRLLVIFFVIVLFAFGYQAIRESSDNFSFGFK